MYLDDHPTALYRFYDGDDALLYVGITHNVEQRFAAHAVKAPWWHEAARQTVEWYDSRAAALAAELHAIRAERPRHNIAGSPWASGPRELTGCEITEGEAKELVRGLELGAALVDPVFVVDRKKERNRVAVLVSPEFYRQAMAAGDTHRPQT
ncbi:GIY-YIG nuclease family protein [Streptomyces qinglanensis]|uniref:GIY-YIG catalytic domain-containing protein n=1 Tax=Streptomyces qinglanensis TaxID=943816 RepID=A0A1H9U556_9ACTN|nr:GIY-YIG nuclease family protein [Streptomyces qinglanensis]SES04203.1 GIY-YIG catalytic domain-containing protein [Streptomyces qinglanensis]